MLLVCHEPFGYFKPGDEVEVPEGAVFDHFYFEQAPKPIEVPPAQEDEE